MASVWLLCQASITDRQTDRASGGKKKAEQQSLDEKRKQVLQNADRSNVQLAVFVMTLTKEEFRCKMRYPACEKVKPST